ncbi:MAG: Asp-tRNA(Asn)/Glu-tRNA(Gln) amidotransferase subunit GatC [Planctomycetes bacterium]|jgi:aspartyl-tRNA(Asn)/glutamyl-tRNA(Gln) amidotransferase subunit C|nr:Asp-tRNA(Asn)/Glu-tRNA(Gln) amidotransferase subunit GatC [Planctomycetota bacterium]MCP4839525.1 Asp-tRNA(Asn)/Glu-tRNA(Gln) amidotransferase subunit GatC [Planctomycetota bacterium]
MDRKHSLDQQQVRHVAALARLALTEEELAGLEQDLQAILHHVDRLAEVDVSDIEPMNSPHGHCSRLHDDEPTEPLPVAAVLEMAPATEADFISVPRVLDGGGAA